MISYLRAYFNLRSQQEINRLITKAARRCVRDYKHALDEIPDDNLTKQVYEHRYQMWKETFWDTAQYRDDLHIEIALLKSRITELEQQLRDNGIKPGTDMPF